MGGLTAISEQQRFPYTCHRNVKVPTFLRLLLTSTSLTPLNIYIKIQQKTHVIKTMLLLFVNVVAWMLLLIIQQQQKLLLLLLLQLPLQSKWILATVCLKLNTKKATFRHRLAHHHVKTGSIKWVLAPRLSQYRETGSVRNLVLQHVIFQRPHEFQYVCHSHYCSSTTFFHYKVNVLRSVIYYGTYVFTQNTLKI